MEPWPNKATRWLFWIFAGVGAYYLITEHPPHLLDYLPYILLMACPLMHLFHGHGRGGGHPGPH
jgi:hypothetical protein